MLFKKKQKDPEVIVTYKLTDHAEEYIAQEIADHLDYHWSTHERYGEPGDVEYLFGIADTLSDGKRLKKIAMALSAFHGLFKPIYVEKIEEIRE